MDIDMPVKDGYETTTEINLFFEELHNKAPVICACSAYKGENDKKKAKKCGMLYFLEKPL